MRSFFFYFFQLNTIFLCENNRFLLKTRLVIRKKRISSKPQQYLSENVQLCNALLVDCFSNNHSHSLLRMWINLRLSKIAVFRSMLNEILTFCGKPMLFFNLNVIRYANSNEIDIEATLKYVIFSLLSLLNKTSCNIFVKMLNRYFPLLCQRIVSFIWLEKENKLK